MRTVESEAAIRSTARAADELPLVRALKRGDESAFITLVERYGASMTRVAALYVSSRAVAEEVVQETWINVLRALDRFEGRSSLRTWIFAILANCAKRQAERERRSIPFAALRAEGGETVEPERFFDSNHPRWPECWTTLVDGWAEIPEDRLLGEETLAIVRTAIESLPPGQRAVMTLRDVEGWTSQEACDFLELTETNQRVLLHRARANVRRVVERHLGGG